MIKTENTVAVFTGKSFDRVISEGGSQSWKLDATRARKCKYLVCTQNAHNPEDYADGTEPHGSAFLVGLISQVSPATDGESSRWKIEFDRYARISQPSVWTGDRNPVRYTTLEELGIDLDDADFLEVQSIPSSTAPPTDASAGPTPGADAGLTIQQAKAGLAQHYGVGVDSIEVVIRG